MAKKTDIGALNVKLNLVTSGFSRGLGKARGDLRRFSRLMNTDVLNMAGFLGGKIVGGLVGVIKQIPAVIGRVISSLTRFAKILGVTVVAAAGAATAAIIALTKQSFSSIDELAKTSDKLGIATENLAIFRLAASEAGVEQNKLEMALQRMTRRVSEAARGTGEAVKALQELGLDARELNKLSPDEIFNRVSEAMGRVGSQSDKIRLAFKLFDSEGVDLVRLFGKSMDDAAKAARMLNLTVSRFDAAQIEAANDAVGRLKSAFQGVGNYIAVQMAPIIKGLSDRVLNWIAANGGVAAITQAVITKVTAKLVEFTNVAAGAINHIREMIGQRFDIGIDTPGNFVQGAIEGMGDLLAALVPVKRGFEALWLTFKWAGVAAVTAVAAILDTLLQGAVNAYNAIPGVRDINLSGWNAAIDQMKADVKVLADDVERAWDDASNTSMLRTQQGIRDVSSAVADTGKQVADFVFKPVLSGLDNLLNKAEALDVEIIERWLAALREYTEAVQTTASEDFSGLFGPKGSGPSKRIAELTESLKKSKMDKILAEQQVFADEITRIWARTADAISDNLASAIVRGQDLFGALKETALQVVEQMLSALLRMLVIAPLFSAFGIPMGGGFGGGGFAVGVFGGGGVSPAFAGGGAVAAGSAGVMNQTVVFNGPVAGERQFKDLAIQAMTESRGENIIKGISERHVKSRFVREPQPLGGY